MKSFNRTLAAIRLKRHRLWWAAPTATVATIVVCALAHNMRGGKQTQIFRYDSIESGGKNNLENI